MLELYEQISIRILSLEQAYIYYGSATCFGPCLGRRKAIT
jgi:hypothetical protein